jgi:2-dehydro-3-deoxy-D-arabinonate dehydratase
MRSKSPVSGSSTVERAVVTDGDSSPSIRKLFRTRDGWILEANGRYLQMPPQAALTARDDLPAYVAELSRELRDAQAPHPGNLLAPVEKQEVWAAGVTYFRSRTARIEEAKAATGGHFYDLVYNAERPELFFKAPAWRVVGSGGTVRFRADADWNVPEPELALVISPKGRIVGYTIGNDMSSRDIEGENPLYLPQAKVYDGACALGPAILVTETPPSPTTRIHLEIRRNGRSEFTGSTVLSEMKRDFETLVKYLYRETSFPDGCVLLTGTGIVPPDGFTLEHGDETLITVDRIGTLHNIVQ